MRRRASGLPTARAKGRAAIEAIKAERRKMQCHQGRSRESRDRPCFVRALDTPAAESSSSRIRSLRHPLRKPSIRLRLNGTYPGSNTSVISISPGHRLAKYAYTATHSNQTQTYHSFGYAGGPAARFTAATAHVRSSAGKKKPRVSGVSELPFISWRMGLLGLADELR